MLALYNLAGGLSGIVRMAVVAVVVSLLAFAGGKLAGYEDGRSSVQIEQATEAARLEKERVADDANLRNLPDYDLCVRSLNARRMSVDECDVMRR
jgi:hypothetical protein